MNKYILLGIVGLLFLGAVYTFVKQTILKSESFPVEKPIEKRPRRESDRVALFAGGCFWSLESYFEKMPEGIVDVVSGYSGGKTENPTYQDYVEGGHREVVEVTYDPTKISYGTLTEYFFRHIDSTDSKGSFYDRGPGYTSAIYYKNEEEKKVVGDIIATINEQKIFDKLIVTEILPKAAFWPAEQVHQNYAANNSARYASYRIGSGRDAFLKKTWEGKERVIYKK